MSRDSKNDCAPISPAQGEERVEGFRGEKGGRISRVFGRQGFRLGMIPGLGNAERVVHGAHDHKDLFSMGDMQRSQEFEQ